MLKISLRSLFSIIIVTNIFILTISQDAEAPAADAPAAAEAPGAAAEAPAAAAADAPAAAAAATSAVETSAAATTASGKTRLVFQVPSKVSLQNLKYYVTYVNDLISAILKLYEKEEVKKLAMHLLFYSNLDKVKDKELIMLARYFREFAGIENDKDGLVLG